jgi:hypothetical protein
MMRWRSAGSRLVIRVRNAMPYDELTGLAAFLVEQEHHRVAEAREQHAGRPRHAKRLAPHRQHVGHEHVRHRVRDQAEALSGQGRESACRLPAL